MRLTEIMLQIEQETASLRKQYAEGFCERDQIAKHADNLACYSLLLRDLMTDHSSAIASQKECRFTLE